MLGERGRSHKFCWMQYWPTSVTARELGRFMGSEMGRSTPSLGKPSTWGRTLGKLDLE